LSRRATATLLATKGRIVTVGSIGGRFSTPFLAPYSASKFAIRAWSDAVRIELAPHGVDVVLIEPGAIDTEIWGKGNEHADRTVGGMNDEQQQRYGVQITAVRKRASLAEKHAISPERVAAVIAKALSAPRPKGRYMVGVDARVQGLVSVLPVRVLDQATRMLLGQPRR
jgi:NAD(P)-dependent dehydrogenase (short-subunit alcohol dehydrogenase family)